jgi:hypothetical protein
MPLFPPCSLISSFSHSKRTYFYLILSPRTLYPHALLLILTILLILCIHIVLNHTHLSNLVVILILFSLLSFGFVWRQRLLFTLP